ncbi:MAG: DUF805 domain-containing protein [Lactobacillus sp.]|jgi:uncharacterized membrane protein YhaH (DUF805 family)|nr:DUF805 domain-containing protein [Lactobacillus sp.]MCI2032689.1 DUF805 domain-containing protein [Lactobacillus sp.]
MIQSTPEEQAITNNQYYRATGHEALIGGIKNTFNYTGRSTRAEFWWLVLFSVGYGVFTLIMGIFVHELMNVLNLLLDIVWLSLITRRYRDVGAPAYLGTVQMGFSVLLSLVLSFGMNPALIYNGFFFASIMLNGFNGIAMFVVTLLPSKPLPTPEEQA